MNEELDNDLKRRISEVFDNYEDPTADEGWMMLREKFPATAKHRGTAWLWWAAAAAVFLLFLGVGMWLKTEEPQTQPQIVKNKPAIIKQADKDKQGSATTEAQPAATAQKEMAIARVDENKTPAAFQTPEAALPIQQKTTNKTATAVPEISIEQTIASIRNTAPPVNTVKKDTAAAIAPKAPVQAYATIKQTQVNTVEKTAPVVTKQPTVQPAQQKQSAMEAMLEREAMANAGKAKEKANKGKLVNFGIYAGTYMNYAEGSENKVNVGAGFSSDFRISKKLRLSTGVSIAQNSFNYAGGSTEVPKVAIQESMVAKTLTANRDFNPSATSAAPTLNNYNARLTGLDVPVNLKYEFNPEKSDTYISAGLSSGTFINESYTYRYDYPAPFSAADDQQTLQVDEKINNSFNGFYFARTLNVAFGVGYPLGKHNRLVIEPFVKYPLSGLGAQQIKFGAGGINLKLNFQTRK